jgi:hypothetical protein
VLEATACNIPAKAQAYSMNLAAIPHSTLQYLTVWATGQAQPNVSTLNSPTGTVTANAAIVPAGTNGSISVFVTDNTDLLVDIDGYFAPNDGTGQSLYTVGPCRALDTRNTTGVFTGQLVPPLDVLGSGCGVPANAGAVLFNSTVVPPGRLRYLTLWPDGRNQPVVSTLNAFDGQVTNNMALVPLTNGSVDAYASDPTQLVLDIFSYFAP